MPPAALHARSSCASSAPADPGPGGAGVASESRQLKSTGHSFLAEKGPVGAASEPAAHATAASYYNPAPSTIHEQPNRAAPSFADSLAQVPSRRALPRCGEG